MRRRMASILTTGAAMAAATALAAIPAAAAPVTITVNNPNSDDHFNAHASDVTLADDTTGVSFTCTSTDTVNASNASGTILDGTYTLPADVGDIEMLDFNNCNGPLGSVDAAPNEGSLPYDLTITSYDSATGAAEGYVGPVDVHVVTGSCSFDVRGNAPGTYTEDSSQGTLAMGTGTLPSGVTPLHPVNVSGCVGLVNPGDELSYVGDYLVTDPVDPPITITSP